MKGISIRLKLKVILMAVSGLAVVVACGAFLGLNAYFFRQTSAQELATLAEIVGRQVEPALASNDPAATTEILGPLRSREDVTGVQILAADGMPFAGYSTGGEAALEVRHDILRDGRPAGAVVLRSDLRQFRERVQRNLLISGLAVLLALLTASLLGAGLERLITRPILHLAGTVKEVAERKDFTLRAVRSTSDETGFLIDGFNDMLAQIQVRDATLRRMRDDLEARVKDRTAELTRSNEVLEIEIAQRKRAHAEIQQENAERRRAEAAMRESEERYRLLFESSPDAILIETEGSVVLMNPAAELLLGAGNPEDLVGNAVFRPALREGTQLRRATDPDAPPGSFEDTWRRLDGRPVEVEVTIIPFSHRGRPGSQIMARDITRRKEADRLKSEFISTVSHELRTPLTAIRGSLGLLAAGKAGALPAVAKPLVDIAHNDCQRLVRLINDLLDIQKIEAGRMDFRMKPIEILPLVERSVETNRSYGDQFGVRFELQKEAEDARVMGDPDRLQQVLANLLSNAAKFSPRGETVDVTVARAGGSIRLSVRDRGPGIPGEFRERIFQKFMQADSSDSRQMGGTGLGLNICKAILERHQGAIGFDPAPGGGTVFWFELPEHAEAPLPVTN